MKKILFLLLLSSLFKFNQLHAGSITIVNNSLTAVFEGYLMADNNVANPSISTTYGKYITVPPSTNLSFASPAALPSPVGMGLPALPTGAFIGIKASINPNPFNVGKAGVYLGYPPYVVNGYIVTWTQIGDDALINIY
ncbi:hypothetical protein [Taibaiella chishuiensis]|uniref:Uncharacterized protein n=1 Tax=Taibaiella chishuiensis TaxID=1434707 RepID=A0A2P8D331_9BACT|nr:hypothetical protein [Taibaiella chishuiensis]PSK91631.1 hypothetical protein B0I18_105216 [Taibaiella chishuiensis]